MSSPTRDSASSSSARTPRPSSRSEANRDLEILQKLYDNGVLLGDQGPDGWGIKYATEFHMTNDSKLFPPRPQWEAKGYQSDEYGHWLKGNWRPIEHFGFDPDKSHREPQHGHWSILDRPEGLVLSVDGTEGMMMDEVRDVALPLYQGAMIHQFDFAYAVRIRRMTSSRLTGLSTSTTCVIHFASWPGDTS